MANEIGKQFDIPVFIHGNCLTHNVVDVPTDTQVVEIRNAKFNCPDLTAHQCADYIKKKFDAELVNPTYHDTTNVPQPEWK